MFRITLFLQVALLCSPTVCAQVVDQQRLLDAQTFWANRDFDWYKANIPFFECPDAELTTTYYGSPLVRVGS